MMAGAATSVVHRQSALGSACLWRHELGRARAGCAVVILFAATWAFYLAILALADRRIGSWQDLRQPGWTVLQGFLPLVCGLGVASILGGAQTFELHLSLPTSLRLTLARRLALVIVPAFLLALAGWFVTDPAGLWGEGAVSTLLQILAPLLLFTGIAALAAALSGSARAAASAVVVMWIAELLLQKSDLVLLIAGVAALLAAWFVLRSDERLLRAASS